MPFSARQIRVVLGLPPRHELPALAAALREYGHITYIEITDTPPVIGRKTIAAAPDVAVCYCAAYDEEMKACISQIVDGTDVPVLVLSDTYHPIQRDFPGGRVLINILPREPDPDRMMRRMRELALQITGTATKKEREKEREDHGIPDLSVPLSEAVLRRSLIAIGSSTGGTEALAKLFRRLPPKMPGIVVVQHMPPVFTRMYAQRLDGELPFTVREAEDGDRVEPGTIFIAPGDFQMTVKAAGEGFKICLGGTEKISGHCPSVDNLFHSVAREAGDRAVGIILTGMGADGALGLLEMRRRGAFTIGQDEESCVVYGMPKKALDYGAVIQEAPLTEIHRALLTHLGKQW